MSARHLTSSAKSMLHFSLRFSNPELLGDIRQAIWIKSCTRGRWGCYLLLTHQSQQAYSQGLIDNVRNIIITEVYLVPSSQVSLGGEILIFNSDSAEVGKSDALPPYPYSKHPRIGR